MARLSAQQRINLTILVAALGYFVDVFDLQLFGLVRVSSLKSLGLTPEQITDIGSHLLNWQMAGMLLGGILWGVLGDKKGRVQVLFGTILLYSLANIANAFVHTIPAYAAARFISGIGLAGEVGVATTLTSELVPKNIRGYAVTLVTTCGVAGPLAANFFVEAVDWRTAYLIGGGGGLLLLLLRISVNESGLFNTVKKESHITRGRLHMLFNNRKRFTRYACCIVSALPIWFSLGILAIFAPELGTALGCDVPLKASVAIIAYFAGITLGNFMSGLLSQFFKSRKKVMAVFLFGIVAVSLFTLNTHGITSSRFYALMTLNGFFTGYWALFMTTTAEQFGTNLRATATTSAPNFVRASVIIDTFLIGVLKPDLGFLPSVRIVAVLCFAVAALALWRLPETFGRDLDFVER